MTRKDYIAIAACFDNSGEVMDEAADAVWKIANSVADVMAVDNPRFDREKFLKACGF